MTLWKSTLMLAALGVFTISFIVGLALLGLNTDRTGGKVPDASEESEDLVDPDEDIEHEETTPEVAGEDGEGSSAGDEGDSNAEAESSFRFRFELSDSPGLPL